MADTKISDLTEDTSPAAGDFLVAVNVSDPTMAASGTDKKVQVGNLPVIGKVAAPTDNALVRWDGTGGKTVQDSAVTLSDAGVLAFDADGEYIDFSGVPATSALQSLVLFSSKVAEGFPSGFNKNPGGGEFLNIVGTVTGASIVSGGVDADTTRRVRISAGGKIFVGPGNAAQDTTLERAAVTAGGWLVASGATAQIPLAIQAIASQSGALTEWRNSSGTPVASVTSAGVFSGSGASLTALVATNLGSGTVPTARLGSGTASSTTFLRGDQTYATPAGTPGGSSGQLQYNGGGSFSGDGGLTWNTGSGILTAGNLVVSSALTVGSLSGLLKAASGTVSAASAGTDYVTPTGSGSGLTSLNAGNLGSGTVPTARLGSGTASSSTYLKGDQTYGVPLNLLVTATDGATVTFNLAPSNLQIVTLGGNRTLALSNVTTGQPFQLLLKQDGTGTRTVTWFSGITWAAGSAPTLTTTINKIDTFAFICTGSGAYLGYVVAQGQ